jgi:hypothetical protein
MVFPSTGRSGANHTTRCHVAGTSDTSTAVWDMKNRTPRGQWTNIDRNEILARR